MNKTIYRGIEIVVSKGELGYNAQIESEDTPCVLNSESEYMARILAKNHIDYLKQKEGKKDEKVSVLV